MTTDPRLDILRGEVTKLRSNWDACRTANEQLLARAVAAEAEVARLRALLDPANDWARGATAWAIHEAKGCPCGLPVDADCDLADAVLAALARLAGQPTDQEEPND